MLLLYIGPEVVAPILSALAAVGGVLLMFWRRVMATARAVGRFVTGKPRKDPSEQEHVAGATGSQGQDG